MSLSKISLLVLSVVCLGVIAPTGGHAQQTDTPFDFKPLLPPGAPLPKNSTVTSGSVGGTQNPYTTAPLQSPQVVPTESAPGIRLNIPRGGRF
jgi:hypothetical protein